MGTLKPQSNRPLYNDTVIGTLAVDGWAVTRAVFVKFQLGGSEFRMATPPPNSKRIGPTRRPQRMAACCLPPYGKVPPQNLKSVDVERRL